MDFRILYNVLKNILEWLQTHFHIASICTKINPKTAARSIINLSRSGDASRRASRLRFVICFGREWDAFEGWLLGQKIPLEVDYRPFLDLHDGAIWSSKSARCVLEITWSRMGASRKGLEAILRRPGGVVEACGAVLEPSGGVFETSLRRLGSV